MKPDRWQVVERLFHEALARPQPERLAFVAREARSDSELRREVEALLGAHDSDPGFLAKPLMGAKRLDPPANLIERGPAKIGPYEIVRPLGQGGMGDVFLAIQRSEAFVRTVALKVVKRGMDTEEVVARFQRERRVLAGLVHPNIAQLLDAGVTDDGRPYFVMEFVDGERIDTYVESHELSVRARLELLRSVCAAVQHAHQKLIVHRDLKPGNILVTREGVPKLVDFGIAKLLTDPGLDAVTRTQLRRFTPGYASPEQLRGEPVTTSTDVFALGVVLFELLAGGCPWPAAEESDASRARRITESLPPRPSQKVGARDSPGLARRLRGDLDTIVLKAMHPEPERRYASAAALSDDIGRHLEGRTVKARVDSLAYRTGKFIGRNRWSVTAGTASVIALVAVAVTNAVQSRRLLHERDKARVVQGFLLETFGATTAEGTSGDSVSVRQLLDGQTNALQTAYADSPDLRSEMLRVLAEGYERLGLYGDAERLASESLALRQRLRSGDHPDVAFSLNLLGWIRYRRGADDTGRAATVLLEESVAMWRRLGSGQRAGLSRALNDLGSVYDDRGLQAEAEAALGEALAIRRGASPPDEKAVAITASNLAALAYRRGDYTVADSLGTLAVEGLRRTVGSDHHRTIIALRNLGYMRSAAGNEIGATEAFRESTAKALHSGGQNARTAEAMTTYGVLLLRQGNVEEALAALRQSLEMTRSVNGPRHSSVANTANTLGLALVAVGRYEEASGVFETAADVAHSVHGENHRAVADARVGLARSYTGQGRLIEARTQLGIALETYRALGVASNPSAVTASLVLGRRLLSGEQSVAAAETLAAAHDLARAAMPPDARQVAETRVWLAEAKLANGDVSAADSLVRVSRSDVSSGTSDSVSTRLASLERRLASARSASN